jgi:hypothetical protein
MKGMKKRESIIKIIQNDRKINKRNKSLMIEKILAYNPMLSQGIEMYKDANNNFILLIILGTLLIDFPLISVPCCILSMFFIIKMLQFIRYSSINNIVIKLAKDLSFRGIYDKEKAQNMIEEFRAKYGEDIIEYEELVTMVDKYEVFVTKIEYVLKTVKRKKDIINYNEDTFLDPKSNIISSEIEEKQYKRKQLNNNYSDFNDKLSVIYKKEDGEIKKVNKAIEFFDDEGNEGCHSINAVVLRNTNKQNKNLTVYLYKKSNILQNNVL